MTQQRVLSRRFYVHICPHCRQTFHHVIANARYCSKRCAAQQRTEAGIYPLSSAAEAAIERRFQLALTILRRRRILQLEATRGLGSWR